MSDIEDPMSEVETMAVVHHSIFEAYVAAGFQRTEAMELLLAWIADRRD